MTQRLLQSTHVTVFRACCRQLLSFRPSLSVDKSIRDGRCALMLPSGGAVSFIRGEGGMVSKASLPFPPPFCDF